MQWGLETGPEFSPARPVFVFMVGQGRVLNERLKTPTATGSAVTERREKASRVLFGIVSGHPTFNRGDCAQQIVYPQRFGLSPSDAGAHSIDCVATANTGDHAL